MADRVHEGQDQLSPFHHAHFQELTVQNYFSEALYDQGIFKMILMKLAIANIQVFYFAKFVIRLKTTSSN